MRRCLSFAACQSHHAARYEVRRQEEIDAIEAGIEAVIAEAGPIHETDGWSPIAAPGLGDEPMGDILPYCLSEEWSLDAAREVAAAPAEDDPAEPPGCRLSMTRLLPQWMIPRLSTSSRLSQ